MHAQVKSFDDNFAEGDFELNGGVLGDVDLGDEQGLGTYDAGADARAEAAEHGVSEAFPPPPTPPAAPASAPEAHAAPTGRSKNPNKKKNKKKKVFDDDEQILAQAAALASEERDALIDKALTEKKHLEVTLTRAPVDCPGGHPMAAVIMHADHDSCVRCRRHTPALAVVARCIQCDVTLCAVCASTYCGGGCESGEGVT